jgi:hypothetical protein
MLRDLIRRAAATRSALGSRLVPARLRTPKARLYGNAAAAVAAWTGATVAVVIALYAPFPTPEQRFGALVGAPAALILPVWRTALLARGVEGARLMRWRRWDCLVVGYALGAAAVAASTAALTVVALRGEAGAVPAGLLLALGAATVLSLSKFYDHRLATEARSAG